MVNRKKERKKSKVKSKMANYECQSSMKERMHAAYFCLLPFAFLLIFGCGYSTKSLLPSYMQKVHIVLFQNRTLKPGLDEQATEKTIEAFRSGSNLVISDLTSADIVIEGEVVSYARDPNTYTSDQKIIDYKLTVKFSARCVDKVKNEVFWEGTVSDWSIYVPDDDEDEAIEEATRKTADKLVNAILTNW